MERIELLNETLGASAKTKVPDGSEDRGTIPTSDEEINERHVIVGDFNMNPWEPGMLLASGFNAHYSHHRHYAIFKEEKERQQSYFDLDASDEQEEEPPETKPYKFASGKEYGGYYNPIWQIIGEANQRGDAQQGTFRYKNPDLPGAERFTPSDIEWNMLDQALFSPGLIDFYEPDSFRILNNGQGECPSDHHPLFFQLNT